MNCKLHRYVAICKPFLSHTMSKLSRAYKFILVSVCFESLLSISNSRETFSLSGHLANIDMPGCSPGKLFKNFCRYAKQGANGFHWILFSILPFSLSQTLFTLHLDETYLICVPKQDYNHLFVVSTFLLFVIPMSIISILYVLIGLQLRKSKIVQRGAVNGSSVRLKVNDRLCRKKLRQFTGACSKLFDRKCQNVTHTIVYSRP